MISLEAEIMNHVAIGLDFTTVSGGIEIVNNDCVIEGRKDQAFSDRDGPYAVVTRISDGPIGTVLRSHELVTTDRDGDALPATDVFVAQGYRTYSTATFQIDVLGDNAFERANRLVVWMQTEEAKELEDRWDFRVLAVRGPRLMSAIHAEEMSEPRTNLDIDVSHVIDYHDLNGPINTTELILNNELPPDSIERTTINLDRRER